MYSIPFSPYYVLFGRILAGVAGVWRPIIIGEVARCFSDEEATSAFSWVGLGFSVGFVGGGAVNFAFIKVDFYIATWHLTYANFIGVFMAFVVFVVTILIYFFVHDLSREYDLKAELMNEEARCAQLGPSDDVIMDEKEAERILEKDSAFQVDCVMGDDHAKISVGSFAKPPSEKTPLLASSELLKTDLIEKEIKKSPRERTISCHNPMLQSGIQSDILSSQRINECDEIEAPPSILMVARVLISNFDTCFILICSFVSMFCFVLFDMWFSLIMVEVMHWGIIEMNIATLGKAFVNILILAVIWKKPPGRTTIFNIGTGCYIGIIIMQVITILLVKMNTIFWLNIVNWVLYSILFGAVGLAESLFLVKAMSEKVPSRVQSFTESVRSTVYQSGALAAMFLSGLLFPYVYQTCLAIIAMLVVVVAILFIRAKHFKSPVEVEFL